MRKVILLLFIYFNTSSLVAQRSSNNNNGVVCRDIVLALPSDDDEIPSTCVSFSIKNNLDYSIDSIEVKFLIYDASNTIIDYQTETFECLNCVTYKNDYIEPHLAKCETAILSGAVGSHKNIYVKLQVIQFKHYNK